MNLEFTSIKPQRVEYFNFRSEDCLNNFKTITDTTKLSKCFNNNLQVSEQVKMWQKTLENIFHKSFKKRRIVSSNKKTDPKCSKLLEERRLLIRKLAKNQSPEISLRLSQIEEEIGHDNIKKYASFMKGHLTDIRKFGSTEKINGCWSLIRKICPKNMTPVPVGKYHNCGNLITDPNGLKKLYLETFLWQLRNRPIRPDLVDFQELKKTMFNTILIFCKKQKCRLWSMNDLESVLSSLKQNKCRDPTGLVNELFSTNNAGKDLKLSIFLLFNSIKETNQIPTFIKIVDISAIYKGKG